MKSKNFPNNAQKIRVLFIINKTSAEMFLRNDGFVERMRKFKEINNFQLISTKFTSHVPFRRERNETIEIYGAGGNHSKRNTGQSKNNNKPPNDNPAKSFRGVARSGKAGYCDFKTDKVFGSCRSCLQDTIAKIGLLFGHHLQSTIHKQIPPDP